MIALEQHDTKLRMRSRGIFFWGGCRSVTIVFLLDQLVNGFSNGSILLLTAIGLALSFGLMRVINMAHGELLMIGGYVTYFCTRVMGPENFLWLAFPTAFVVTALLGVLLEFLVIRKLYGRTLDTLLATWGIGLILQQGARQLFGPTGVPVNAPSWLSGQWILGETSIPHVRIFVFILAIVVLLTTIALISKTRFGLNIRAVNQNREIASSLGINTKLIDMSIFAFGSGLAGIAGVGMALISSVTPTVGSSYIIGAFLVVMLGGMGSLWGTALAALLVAMVGAIASSLTTESLSQVVALVAVIVFLQLRPKGIFPQRGRSLEEA